MSPGRILLSTLARPGALAWVVASLLGAAAALLPPFQGGVLVRGALGMGVLLVLSTARAWTPRRAVAENLVIFVVVLVAALLLMRTAEIVRVGLAPIVLLLTILVSSAWITKRFAPDLGQSGVVWLLCTVAPLGVWAGGGMVLSMLVIAGHRFNIGGLEPIVYAAGAWVGRLIGLAASREMPPQMVQFGKRARASVADPADWWKHG